MQPSLCITLNGAPREVRAGASLADLLAELGLQRSAIAVERNRRLVRAPEQAATALAEGDQIEVVTLVGGG